MSTKNSDADCAHSPGPQEQSASLAVADSSLLASLNDIVMARIRFGLLRLFVKLKHDLDLEVKAEEKSLALMRESVPTYATALVLRGEVRFPTYDEWPSGPVFYSPREFWIAIPPMSANEVRKHVTAAVLRLARRRWDEHYRRRSVIHECFQILDEFNRVVMIGRIKTWHPGQPRCPVEWLPSPESSKVDEMKRQAKKYEVEAATEAGWDNFDTARNLRDSARKLRDSASYAQYGINLIP